MAVLNLRTNWLLILYVSCICGFLNQCYNLYSDYMSGKTVVNIKVETILNQTLPGITICYPYFHLPETLGENKTILRELKQNYEDYFNYEKTLDNSTLKQNINKRRLIKHESWNRIEDYFQSFTERIQRI